MKFAWFFLFSCEFLRKSIEISLFRHQIQCLRIKSIEIVEFLKKTSEFLRIATFNWDQTQKWTATESTRIFSIVTKFCFVFVCEWRKSISLDISSSASFNTHKNRWETNKFWILFFDRFDCIWYGNGTHDTLEKNWSIGNITEMK